MQCIERVENLLKFVLAKGVGCITMNRLLRRFGSSDAILGASEAEIAAVEGVAKNHVKAVLSARRVNVQEELDMAHEAGVQLVPYDDPLFPKLLFQIPDPPYLLYVKGELKLADNRGVGIVGTRYATDYGLQQAERFGVALAGAGYTVFSGLARGIDTFAHRGALQSGGRTIGVVGNGLSHVYPPENRDLYMELTHGGAVISEMPMEMEPSRESFPRRNRIIAGLSLGVLVVEAPLRSGALITARQAIDYGREVFAIPGRIDHENAQGCNKLIRDGAALIGNSADILDELRNCCGYADAVVENEQACKPVVGADIPDVRTEDDVRLADGMADLPDAGSGDAQKKNRKSSGAGKNRYFEIGEQALDEPVVDNTKLDAVKSEVNAAADKEKKILAQVGREPVHIDTIISGMDIPVGEVSATLMILELKGLVKQHPGKMFTLR